MDPSFLFDALKDFNILSIFELLLKWAIPFFFILILKELITNFASYVLVRSDKYIAIGKWITYRGYTGCIINLTPFSVVIQCNDNSRYKIPIRDFKHIIFHPIIDDPTYK